MILHSLKEEPRADDDGEAIDQTSLQQPLGGPIGAKSKYEPPIGAKSKDEVLEGCHVWH